MQRRPVLLAAGLLAAGLLAAGLLAAGLLAAPRIVRGRSSQVKGAFGVAARSLRDP